MIYGQALLLINHKSYGFRLSGSIEFSCKKIKMEGISYIIIQLYYHYIHGKRVFKLQ